MQTALIVDDSALARLTLKRFLKKHGLDVFEAECVADCRYWLRHNRQPDVVFMDITMPEVDGFEALAEIRSDPETKNLPVIMYSGDASEEARQKARDGKATGFLRKPVNEQQLNAMLEKLNERTQPKRDSGVPPEIAAEAVATVEAALVRQTTDEAIAGELRSLRHDVGQMYVAFERQQESLFSLKTMVQRQSNDLVHLQNRLQEKERAVKLLSISTWVGVAMSILALVLAISAIL